MDWNPLLCSPSPRDIEKVRDALMECPYDILYAKYYREKLAVTNLYEYFMAHPEYTHFIYCPDDLVIRPEHLSSLKKILDARDYPILSGVCNVDLDDMKDFLSITYNLPHPAKHIKGKQLGWRYYHWYHKNDGNGVVQTLHSGFAAQIIRRDVLEKIKFDNDASFNPLENPNEAGSADVMFSNTCAIACLPIVASLDVRMLHLRHHGKIEITLGNPFMEFHKWDGRKHVKHNA